MKKRKTVSVTCKDCGLVFEKVNYSLKGWKGRCHPCARFEVRRRGKTSDDPVMRKIQVLVKCIDCSREWLKRQDSLQGWGGRCLPCARIEIASRPNVREAKKRNGISVMVRVGRLPQPKPENRKRGASHHNWRGGITPEVMMIRHSKATKDWRKAVFIRDRFQCVACRAAKRKDITADHIQPFSLFPELRFDVSNGRTLCQGCHKKYGARVYKDVIIKAASFDYEGIGNGTVWKVMGS